MAYTQPTCIRLHPNDNVVIATRRLDLGSPVPGEEAVTRSTVPAGHKIATHPIAIGERVRKYDQIIGVASDTIKAGDHVHTHNLEMAEFQRDYAWSTDAAPTAFVPEDDRATFNGFVREDGRIGTRNYIGILTTVNCSATVARMIAARFDTGTTSEYPNVDGVCAFVHGTGCGMASNGEGFEILQRTLYGYARHPNFAGVLLVGTRVRGGPDRPTARRLRNPARAFVPGHDHPVERRHAQVRRRGGEAGRSDARGGPVPAA